MSQCPAAHTGALPESAPLGLGPPLCLRFRPLPTNRVATAWASVPECHLTTGVQVRRSISMNSHSPPFVLCVYARTAVKPARS